LAERSVTQRVGKKEGEQNQIGLLGADQPEKRERDEHHADAADTIDHLAITATLSARTVFS
jgi:hypothetical protein